MNTKADNYVVVLVTAKDREEAGRIGEAVVQAKLAACVNIAGDVRSVFWWDKKIDNAEEVLLIIKSRLDMFDALCEKVKAVHSYDVPEIIALPIIAGSEPYLNWINESLQ